MRRGDRYLVLLLPLIALLGGCPRTSLEGLVEDKFEGFEGMDVALRREYIVGLQPEEGFPNLHCCWVGTRSGWQEIGKTWTVTNQTEVNADVLGVLKAVSIEIDAKVTAFIEAVAEGIYRDQLLDLRHLYQPHCDRHEETCAKKICVDSIKLGSVKVTSYVEVGAGVGVGAAAGKANIPLVKIGDKNYEKHVTEQKDIIVAYKMAETLCGPPNVIPKWGDGNTGQEPKKGENYQQHLERYRAELEKQNRQHAFAPGMPSENARIIPSNAREVASILAPPAGTGVIAGNVIRVSTVDKNDAPAHSLTGIVVSERDAQGRENTRTVTTDASGGAWIAVSGGTAALSLAAGGRRMFETAVQRSSGSGPSAPPVFTGVQPLRGDTPPGIVEEGRLVVASGTNCSEVTAVRIDSQEVTPAASGNNYVVFRPESTGTVQVQPMRLDGLRGSPMPVTIVGIEPEVRPPAALQSGQTAELVLAVKGTEQPVPVQLSVRSGSIRLAGGSAAQRMMSSGGAKNVVRTTIQAQRSGPYQIDYRLTR